MDNLCRACMRLPDNLISLFEDSLLPYKIAVISSVEIHRDDDLPSGICEECIKNINLCYNFRNVIINTDLELKERHSALQRTKFNKPEFEYIDEPIENLSEDDLSIKEEQQEQSKKIIKKKGTQKFNRTERSKYLQSMLRCYKKKTYQCKTCDFKCTEMSQWQSHKRTVHYPHGICNICGKSIRTDNLSKHVKAHSESPVTCPECGKVFKNSESLRSHTFIHSETNLMCEFCGKTYKYRGEYNRHLRRHALGGAKTVPCPICQKMFADKKYLKKHMRSHTGERPYKCQYCQKGFSSGYALKTHIRQHTNEKPYACEFCPMAFPQKVSLKTHLKSKHSDLNTDVINC